MHPIHGCHQCYRKFCHYYQSTTMLSLAIISICEPLEFFFKLVEVNSWSKQIIIIIWRDLLINSFDYMLIRTQSFKLILIAIFLKKNLQQFNRKREALLEIKLLSSSVIECVLFKYSLLLCHQLNDAKCKGKLNWYNLNAMSQFHMILNCCSFFSFSFFSIIK